jgi:hypothetical protein
MRLGVGRQIEAVFVGGHDIGEAVDGLHHLSHALVAFALRSRHDLHGLSQSFVPLNQFFKTFFEGHSIPGSFLMIAAPELRDVFSIHGE